ncbi:hypothetical protein ILUMI_06468 [Ignelater luminosus]|uniref:HTH CENPB-type domain-containing protein n=1 Tax=Ignelater luminosus TaxID=2038154 RepID=A0A8K0DA75_IGNLU|nr:hypothetical protein ILUMI_06468 [Ignelater luminosus]
MQDNMEVRQKKTDKTAGKFRENVMREAVNLVINAKANNIKISKSWENPRKASFDWYKGFLKRHPNIFLRTPEGCSLARAEGFNEVNAESFFTKLENVLQRHTNFLSGLRIYNRDETETLRVQKNLVRVLAEKGTRQVSKIQSSERGTLVATCCTSHMLAGVSSNSGSIICGNRLSSINKPVNIAADYKKTEIHPYDRRVFTEKNFLASQVTERTLVNLLNTDPRAFTSASTTHIPIEAHLSPMHEELTTYSPTRNIIATTFISPSDIRGNPKKTRTVSSINRRRKGKTMIASDASEKTEIENIE